MSETLRELRQLGFEGFQAYSEGVFDDCNKMLLAGLGSGQFESADAALRAYARRYFAAPPEHAADWARWLAPWGDGKKVPLPAAAEELARLSAGVPPTWRVAHWRSRVELETLDRAIGNPKEWTPEKLALADQYLAAQEQLYREVYRLGPVRHVLNPRFTPPTWFEAWNKANKQASGTKQALPQQ